MVDDALDGRSRREAVVEQDREATKAWTVPLFKKTIITVDKNGFDHT